MYVTISQQTSESDVIVKSYLIHKEKFISNASSHDCFFSVLTAHDHFWLKRELLIRVAVWFYLDFYHRIVYMVLSE